MMGLGTRRAHLIALLLCSMVVTGASLWEVATRENLHSQVSMEIVQGTTWLRWSAIGMVYVCEYPFNITARNDGPHNMTVVASITISSGFVGSYPSMYNKTWMYVGLRAGTSVTEPGGFEGRSVPNSNPPQCPPATVALLSYDVWSA